MWTRSAARVSHTCTDVRSVSSIALRAFDFNHGPRPADGVKARSNRRGGAVPVLGIAQRVLPAGGAGEERGDPSGLRCAGSREQPTPGKASVDRSIC